MIITVPKPFIEITEKLKGYNNVFIVGCASCATKCQTGNEEAIKKISIEIENIGKKITGYLVLDTPCDIRVAKKDLSRSDQVKASDIILVLACGAGIGAIEKAVDKPLCTGLNPIFVGTTERIGVYHDFCVVCGECITDKTGGICPKARCAKSLSNGPCGGVINGKCETNLQNDCAWILIYNKLKHTKKDINILKEYVLPKKYSKPVMLSKL